MNLAEQYQPAFLDCSNHLIDVVVIDKNSSVLGLVKSWQ